jgi:hypothetical protein
MNTKKITSIMLVLCTGFLQAEAFGQVDKEGRAKDPTVAPARTDHPLERVEAQVTGRSERMTGAEVDRVAGNWSREHQDMIRTLREKYGEPHEATGSVIKWRDTGGFKYTKLMASSVDHDFPRPHKDRLEQGVQYRVPPDRASDLAAFNGSITFDRTKGILASRCDREEHNILALNLAHEVITGARSVEEARDMYARLVLNEDAREDREYLEALMFDPQGDDAADKDEPHRSAGR